MSMSERDRELVIDNDREWRKFMLNQIETIRESQTSMLITVTTLKVKFGLIGGFFGFLGGSLGALITILTYLKKHL